MRHILHFVFLIWLSALPAFSETWSFDDISLTGLGARQSKFVYVPKGQYFEDVQFKFETSPGLLPQRLILQLNGRPLDTLRWQASEKFTIDLPDLPAGFHRIDVLGWPSLDRLDSADDRCAVMQPPHLSLYDPTLEYEKVFNDEAFLSDLPEGLYNPSHPEPPIGWLDLGEPEALSAAARLISGWRANGRINWLVSNELVENADFRVSFRFYKTMMPEALIYFEPFSEALESDNSMPEGTKRHTIPTLYIDYRSQEGLVAAVHRLLDPDQRLQLLARQAEIYRAVKEPAWATIKNFQTLADLGFEDLNLLGTQELSLGLPFPPHWQPTGPLEGTLYVRSQAGLPEGSRLDAWIDGGLAGSLPVVGFPSQSIQYVVPLESGGTPQVASLGLRLDSELEISRLCTWPLHGSIWIDAKRTKLQLPHVVKSGVMALVPRLLADPSISLDKSYPQQGLQLLSGLMELVHLAGTPDPTAYQINLGSLDTEHTETAPSLSILIDEALEGRLEARYPQLVTPGFVSGALRWQADDDGRSRITATSPEILRQAASVIADIGYRIPDGARDVLIHAKEGTLVILDKQARVVAEPASKVSRQELEWGILVVLGMLAVIVLTLLFRRLRRGTSG